MKEVWKDIPGYEGLYKISNFGNIISLTPCTNENGSKQKAEQSLKASKSSTGYLHVQLYKNGKSTTVNVHRLVASVFVPNPENKPEVNHIDANRSNNISSNLEWVTHSENMKHAVLLDNKDMAFVRSHKKYHKYCILQYSITGDFIKEWENVDKIKNELNVTYSSISACLNGIHKSAHGYMWIKRHPNETIQPKVEPLVRMTGKSKKKCKHIAQYDKQNNLIRIWNDYTEIQNDPLFGKSSMANITKCANGKRKSAKGYIWKYI